MTTENTSPEGVLSEQSVPETVTNAPAKPKTTRKRTAKPAAPKDDTTAKDAVAKKTSPRTTGKKKTAKEQGGDAESSSPAAPSLSTENTAPAPEKKSRRSSSASRSRKSAASQEAATTAPVAEPETPSPVQTASQADATLPVKTTAKKAAPAKRAQHAPRPRSVAEADAMLAEQKAARSARLAAAEKKAGPADVAEKGNAGEPAFTPSHTGQADVGGQAQEQISEQPPEQAGDSAGSGEGEQKRRRRSRRGGRRRKKNGVQTADGTETEEAAAAETEEETPELDADDAAPDTESDKTLDDDDDSELPEDDDSDDISDDAPPVQDAGQATGRNRGRGKRVQQNAAPESKNAVPRKMFISILSGEQVEVVLTEEGQVQEYYVEMMHQAKIKGNIYKGVVSNVDANLQAAFVSYGGNKNGFLQIDEVHPEYYQIPHDPNKGRKYPLIQKALKPGQEILVQVVKEPAGTKGAFLTSYLSLPGRFLVLTPGREQIGVSRKVDNEEERARLREMLNGLKPGVGLGVIVRTVSMGSTKTSLQRDLQFLKRLWKEVRTKGTTVSAPSLIYQELDLSTRAIRDYLTDDVAEVWVDDESMAATMQDMADILFPRKKGLVHTHKEPGQTLFERFSLQKQLDQIYSREVVLPSGGRLVFDHTEALTAIDINSSRSGGKNNFEDMAYRTNIEAARMIPLQLRLRDIGGQVVADFIEMRDREHWREVEKAVRNGMKGDRARYDVGKIGPFGMLEIVRQRLGSSAISVSTEPCPCCKGTGVRRNMEWQAMRALREIQKLMRQAAAQKQPGITFQTEKELALHLLNTKRGALETLEKDSGIRLTVAIGL